MKKTDLPEKFKKLVSNCDVEVRDYMLSVMEQIQNDYGKIEDGYYISLKLIRDNYECYNNSMKEISNYGALITDSRGDTHKNPAFTIAWAAQRNITDLLKSFALTPMTKSKMKVLQKGGGDTTESPLDAFLKDN